MERSASKLLFGAVLFGTLTLGIQTAVAEGQSITAGAELKSLDGTVIGAAQITQSPHGVLVHIRINDLPPGAKGVHFHAKADCAANTGFNSSKGHHGEGEGEHGLLNPRGPGKGDLGNIFVGQDGIGEMQFFKTGVFLEGGELPLLDEDGTAIVIHANPDDQMTQPIGGSGPRIVCGLVEAS